MKKILYLFILIFLFTSVSQSSLALTNKRIALVIGNAAYESAKLKNPANDAKDMANALRKLNFEVIELIDADLLAMDTAVNNFGRKLENGNGVGLFFYAGHGVQSKGRNYLIPIGADISRETELKYKTLDAGKIFDEMGYAENGLNIVILDACRNNPLTRSFRSAKRGLAKPNETPSGLLLAYSTSPGKQAADGSGRNSPYTKHLLQAMKKEGLPLEMVFKDVIKQVKKETRGQQIPWVSSSVDGDFYFTKKELNNNKTLSQQTDLVVKKNNINNNNSAKFELLFWESVIQNPSAKKYQVYIEKYPEGHFREIAASELSRYKKTTLNNVARNKQSAKRNYSSPQLARCEQFLKEYKLSSGSNGNALDCYNSILKQEPGNKAALAGLLKIEQAYIRLIKRSIKQQQISKAEHYLTKLETINKQQSQLPYLKKLLLEKEKQHQPTVTNKTVKKQVRQAHLNGDLNDVQQQIFDEYAEVVDDLLQQQNLSEKEKKKIEKYLLKLENISPEHDKLQVLKQTYDFRLTGKQPVLLNDDDQQIFDEYMEIVNELLERNDLNERELKKISKYLKKLEKINSSSQGLAKAKVQYERIK